MKRDLGEAAVILVACVAAAACAFLLGPRDANAAETWNITTLASPLPGAAAGVAQRAESVTSGSAA